MRLPPSAHIDRLALSLHNGSGRLVWIGDSITSQHFWATACMLGAALPPPRVWLNGRTFTPASTRALHSSLRPSLLRLASSQPATKSSGGRRSDLSSSNSDSICVFVATRIGRLQLCHVLHKVSSSWPGAHASLGALFNALAASGGLSQKDVVIANSGLHHRAGLRQSKSTLDGDVTSLLGAYEKLKPERRPTLIWRETSPTSFPTHDGDYAPGGFPPSSTCNGSSALSTPLRHATMHTSSDAVPAGSYNAISNPLVAAAGVPILYTYDLRTHRPSDHIGWSERRRATGDVVREVLDCAHYCLPSVTLDRWSSDLVDLVVRLRLESFATLGIPEQGVAHSNPPTIAARPLEATKASSSTQLLGMQEVGMQEDDSLPDAIAQLARELGVQDAVIQRMKKLETRRVHARIGERSLTFRVGIDESPEKIAGEINAIILRDVYGLRRLPANGTLLDIGVNLGLSAVAAYVRGQGCVRILGLEPMPEAFVLLLWNAAANGVPLLANDDEWRRAALHVVKQRVEADAAGTHYGQRRRISMKDGKTARDCGGLRPLSRAVTANGRQVRLEVGRASMNAHEAPSRASQPVPGVPDETIRQWGSVREYSVQSTTLEQLVQLYATRSIAQEAAARSFDLLKIDCEGCETELLRHLRGSPVLSSAFQHVAGEIHRCGGLASQHAHAAKAQHIATSSECRENLSFIRQRWGLNDTRRFERSA